MSTVGLLRKTRDLYDGGDQRKADIDFEELFAPTVAVSLVRSLVAMTCESDLYLCRFDIGQAFVQATLEDV